MAHNHESAWISLNNDASHYPTHLKFIGGPSGYCIKFNSHVNKLDLSNIKLKTQSKMLMESGLARNEVIFKWYNLGCSFIVRYNHTMKKNLSMHYSLYVTQFNDIRVVDINMIGVQPPTQSYGGALI